MFDNKKEVDRLTPDSAKQKAVLQKSNRVFILQYSPDRSPSKKQKKWDLAETQHQKGKKIVVKTEHYEQRDKQTLGETLEGQIDHRSNLQRLRNLIRSSRTGASSSVTGCEKLVLILQKLRFRRPFMKECFQTMKKDTMTASSNNYQLFIQSRHNNFFKESVKLSDTKKIGLVLDQISENNNQQNTFSNQLSKDSPYVPRFMNYARKTEENEPKEDNSITFNKWDSPRQIKQNLAWTPSTKGNITTREQLNQSCNTDLILTPKVTVTPKLFYNQIAKKAIICNLHQNSFSFSKYEQFQINSCQLKELSVQEVSHNQKEPVSILMQSDRIINAVEQIYSKKQDFIESETQKLLKQFEQKIKPTNFPYAISTSPAKQSVIMRPKSKIKINYVVPSAEANRANPKKPSKKNTVLTSTQLAQKMLFGTDKPKQIKPQTVPAAESTRPTKIRVSSMPKITFTYSSRDKDGRYEKPSPVKQIITPISTKQIASPQKQILRPMVKIQSKKIVKEQLQSTFNSTSNGGDKSGNYKMTHIRSAQQLPRNLEMQPMRRQNIQTNLINKNMQMQMQTKIIHQLGNFNKISVVNRVDNEYYGSINNNNRPKNVVNSPTFAQRQRIMSTQPHLQSNQIQFIGIQDGLQARCCWDRKQGRSKSLNDNVLTGLTPKPTTRAF